mgnify:CR=1 FL=1
MLCGDLLRRRLGAEQYGLGVGETRKLKLDLTQIAGLPSFISQCPETLDQCLALIGNSQPLGGDVDHTERAE